MTSLSDVPLMSNEALVRLLVAAIGYAGAGVCVLAALGAQDGGIRYLMALGAIGFVLSALLPRSFAPRFGQFLCFVVGAMTLMGMGGGIKVDVSLYDWLTILPFLLFALLLSFPGGAVALFRRMIRAGH